MIRWHFGDKVCLEQAAKKHLTRSVTSVPVESLSQSLEYRYCSMESGHRWLHTELTVWLHLLCPRPHRGELSADARLTSV